MNATGNPAADIAAVQQRFLQFFANKDLAGLAGCYTEDAQMMVANMDVISGRGAIASVFKFTAVRGHTLDFEDAGARGAGRRRDRGRPLYPPARRWLDVRSRQVHGGVEASGGKLAHPPRHVQHQPGEDTGPRAGLNVSKLRLKISMSLDGFVAGPDQSVDNPLGVGGMRLHEWVFPLAAWRRCTAGRRRGERELARWSRSRWPTSAPPIMGRNMFGGHPGPWDAAEAVERLVGRQPAVPSPGVRAHASPARAARCWRAERRSRSSPTASRRRSSRRGGPPAGKDVSLAGGAEAPRSSTWRPGSVDEMEINLVPTLLGSGERLFDGVGDDLHGLRLVRTVAAPQRDASEVRARARAARASQRAGWSS